MCLVEVAHAGEQLARLAGQVAAVVLLDDLGEGVDGPQGSPQVV